MFDRSIKSNMSQEKKFYGQVKDSRQISAITLSEIIHKNPIRLPEHFHELAHFALVIKGSYSETFASKMYRHSPMEIIWHRAGISHQDEIGERGACFFTIEFQPEYLINLSEFAALPNDFFERDGLIVRQAQQLYDEFKNWRTGSDQIIEGLTLQMLGHSVRKQISEKYPPIWLVRVVKRLNEEFRTNLSIGKLALEAGVHPVYLASVFRRFYQENISEYVQKLRVNYASELLLGKKVSISEIAFLAGFADQSHFTRVFKRYVGTTPGAFRNQSQSTFKRFQL
jgi:AraC family transcriptional regulator